MRALVLVLLLVPLATAQADILSAEERAWLDAHGPIRYAPDPGYPPFEAVNEGVAEGINVDLLNRMSRNLDIEFETVVYDNWTAVLDAMRAGEVDLLGSLAQTPEREEYMDFFGPYMQVGEVFYVRTDSTYTSNDDMAGKRVAVIQDYAAADWIADNRPDVIAVPVPDMLSGLEALAVGEVDAFFENIPVAGFVIRQEGFTNIKILDEPLYYSEANWGVPEGNEIMMSIITKGMQSIPLGEQTAVFEFWSGYDLGVRRDDNSAPAWVSPTLWTASIVLLVGAVWIVSLRSTVHNRTQELRDLNEGLEQRVAERTQELEEANERLGAFASSVSHDLRQPLSAMKMQAQIAQRLLVKGQTPDLTPLDLTVDRMNGFIETMLHFSQDAEPGARIDTPIEPIVTELAGLLQTNATITADDSIANADPQLLRLVLLNLIGNAAKFSPDDATIEVGGNGETFYVKDNGPGFDAAAVGRSIFEPFVRAETGVQGLGIGLATVTRIINGHGGRIWAESTPGNGATFWFTLPREKGEKIQD